MLRPLDYCISLQVKSLEFPDGAEMQFQSACVIYKNMAYLSAFIAVMRGSAPIIRYMRRADTIKLFSLHKF